MILNTNTINNGYIKYLKQALIKYIRTIHLKKNEIQIITNTQHVKSILYFLRDHSLAQFKILSDIVCYDVPGANNRFILVYHLLSLRFNIRISILTRIDEKTPMESVTSLYSSANWQEREVWDMFGIFFFNHPDLRRILTDYGFDGFPLRKDFPLVGFTEVIYDDSVKKIITRPVILSQEYREFNFKNPWNRN